MDILKYISDNVILFALILIAAYFAIRYWALPALKKRGNIPADFDPFKNLEQQNGRTEKN